ncbi:MAG TPA: ABC transporter permease subunit [Reyranella sp.]|jgi:putrescine transport system permease protein|nr:ABC transporter permease subunit [Reyranella sp.]
MRFVIALPFAWLAAFFLLPLALVLGLSFGTNSPDLAPPVELGVNFASFKLLFTDDLYLAAWLSSLRIAALSTLGTLLLGYPMAYAIVRARPQLRPLLLTLVILPFWTSFLIRVYAWMGLLAENGILNQVLRWSGLVPNPGTILGTEWAIHLGIIYAYLPFMVLPLYSSLEKLDWGLLEAASDLGAKPLAAFVTVTLPLSMPGIVAGCLMVFIPAVGEFVIPDLLGGTRTLMIGKVLWDEFFTNSDWPLASAVAICLLVLLVGPIVIFQRHQQRSLERT